VTVDGELFGDTLPTYLTRFIGRELEVRAVQSLMSSSRLVTVCGVGGAGKTRLAIEVARRHRSASTAAEDGVEVYWVPLGAVTDASEVSAAVATGVGLTGSLGARAASGLVNVLSDRRVLLLLDNCEQVVAGCQELLTRVLPACAQLAVLATSRVPLGVAGEEIFAVPQLGGAKVPTDPFASDATSLFLERARLVAPTYALTKNNAETVAEICDALHGSPLAIELAASWIHALSPGDLLAEITQTSDALTSRSAMVEDRHRSLRAILDSSWGWLDESQRSVLSCLALFIGGFTREAARAVAGAEPDSLATLISRSMMQRLPDAVGGSRYQVHELVRSYALSRLEEVDAVAERHFAYFLDLVESLEPSWNTPVEPVWSNPISADLGNIDAATVWALGRGDAEKALRMAVGLDAFWIFSSPSPTVRQARLEAALDLPWEPSSVAAVRARAKAYHLVGLREGRTDRAQRLLRAGQALFRQVGDQAGVAACIRDHGAASLDAGDAKSCRGDVLESLALCRGCGDAQGAAWCVVLLGRVALVFGELDEAVTYLTDAIAQFERLGSPFGACHGRVELAEAHRRGGRWAAAVAAYHRAFQDQQIHHFTVDSGAIIEGLAVIAAALHHFELAARLCGVAAAWRRTYDETYWLGNPDAFETSADKIRRHLGAEAWLRAYAQGNTATYGAATRLVAEAIQNLAAELQVAPSGLTSREVDVLRLVAVGLSNAEIADQLVLSPRTVHAHLRSIFDKLKVTSRTAAAHAAASLLPKDITVEGRSRSAS
jgi:non-specific serine/threonine protein kinase